MTPVEPSPTALPARGAMRTLGGWGLLAASLLYVGVLHQGLGAAPVRQAPEWWHPSRFMATWAWLEPLEARPLLGALAFALPPALALIGVALGTRSAIARWLATSAPLCAALFGFYGLAALGPWEFFHWRGSLVMICIALSVGAALASPWLARSWLQRGPLARSWLYLGVWLLVVTLLRHTTGTDESLAFNFSPWPALTIFGLEIGAYAAVGLILGAACVALGASLWPRARAVACLLTLAGVAAPTLWLIARFGSLPGDSMTPLGVLGGLAVLPAALTKKGERAARLRERALHCALGAALVYVALFSGRALATGDYTLTRFVRAQRIIDGLANYYAEHGEYPEDLSVLTEEGELSEIPHPKLGFELAYAANLLKRPAFHYQSLGSSYVLEFVGTEWVQCAYNPPWEDEEEDEGEIESLDEAWSCPESRPELW